MNEEILFALITQVLKQSEEFRSLPEETLTKLASRASIKEYRKDAQIISQGKPIGAIMVLTYGKLEVSVDGCSVEQLEPNSGLIGEHEVLNYELNAKSSVIVVSQRARLLVIDRTQFMDIWDRQPTLALGISQALGRRHNRMSLKVNRWFELTKRTLNTVKLLESSLKQIKSASQIREEGDKRVVGLRYIVSVLPKALLPWQVKKLKQAYIALKNGDEIRIRSEEGKYTITGKKDYKGREIEISLDLEEYLFNMLISHAGGRVLTKKRYIIDHEGYRWRVDVFDEGTKCSGLIIAEVDIIEGEQIPNLPPGFKIIKDITDELNYRNRNLALYGKPTL